MLVSIHRRIQSSPKRLITYFEQTSIPLIFYFLTFVAIVILRQFLEAFSQTWNYFHTPSLVFFIDFVHGCLSYIAIGLLITSLFHFATKRPVADILRVVLPSFILLILTPLLDLIFTLGHGVNIMYLLPELVPNLTYTYFTIGGNYAGNSLGMRIEVMIVLVGCFIYFRVKKLSFVYSLIYTWLTYSLIFLIATSPYFLQWLLEITGFTYAFSSLLMIHFYLILIFILGCKLFYWGNKDFFISFFTRLNLQRVIHYELLFLLGVAIGFNNNTFSLSDYIHIYQDSIINIVLCLLSILFLFIALTANKVIATNKNTAHAIRYFFLFLALFYACIAEVKAAFIISLMMASLYLYAMPPLQLKRIIIFSKLLLGLNVLALVLLGYLLIHHDLYGFPNSLFFICLVAYSLAACLIDLSKVKLQNPTANRLRLFLQESTLLACSNVVMVFLILLFTCYLRRGL